MTSTRTCHQLYHYLVVILPTLILHDMNSSGRGILVRLVMCVMVGHRKLKIEIIKLLTIVC